MIHGLSKHSRSGASAALNYFLDAEHYDKDEGRWKPRDPAPVCLGSVEQLEAIAALCDSLDFAHKYTSGVLSFSPEETARIDSTPGMKDRLIEEFKRFAFAGIDENEDQLIGLVEHRHTGRLEVHYLIPRVHPESGKYFNPFPPNYDGRRGNGSNDVFIAQNDAFVDHICEKYGLQNPRDPQFARVHKLEPFDPARNIKRQVVDAIDQLVDAKTIGGRDDIVSFLQGCGATVTRTGADYLSFKFPEMGKAVRLKGELYGERSYEEIGRRHRGAQEEFEAQRASAGSRYREALDQRASEVEKRHSIPGRTVERNAAELQQTIGELQQLKNDIGNFAPNVRNSARSFVAQNPLAMSMPNEYVDVVGEACNPDAGTDAIKTGNPVLDEFSRKMHAHFKKLEQEGIAIMMRGIKESAAEYERISKALSKTLSNLFRVSVGLYTGRPGFYPPMKQDLRFCGQLLRNEINALRDDIKYLRDVEAQADRVDKRIFTPLQAASKLRAGKHDLPGDPALLGDLVKASREAKPVLDELARKGQGDATLGD